MKIKKFLQKTWPILIITLLVFLFFWRFFIKGLVPIPADFIVGTYFPWLDYKWGYPAGVPVKNPILSDVVSVIYLLRNQTVDIFKNGSLPLWNNYSFSGYPLLANPQAAVLYPLNILYLFFPKLIGWSLQVISQPLFAGIFMYLYLRVIIKKKLACLFGAIAFAFSGFVIIFLEYNVQAHAAMFLPLLFLAAEKMGSKKRRLIWGVIFSFSLASQILAGYPQVSIYSLLALGLYVLFKRDMKLILSLSFFVSMGVALVASFLFPAAELLSLSQRVQEGSQEGLAFLPWTELINFLAPDFFGNPATGNFWGEGNYTNLVGYTGIVSFIFALISISQIRRKKEIQFFFFLLLGSLLLSLPTPLASFLGNLKWFGLGAASATRSLFLANFSIAFLGAYGFQLFYKKKLSPSFYKIPVLLTVASIGIVIGVFVARQLMIPYEQIFQDQDEAFKIVSYWTINLKVTLRNMVLPALLAFSLTGLVWIIYRIRILKSLGLIMALFLLIAELFRFGWKYLPFSQRGHLFPETPVIEFLKDQPRPFRVSGGNVIPMNMWAAFGFQSPAGYDSVYPLRYAKFLTVVNGGQLNSPASRYGDIRRLDSPLIDLVNTKYILALKYDKNGVVDPEGEILTAFQLPKLRPVFKDKSVVVLENTEVLPRAFLVYDYQVETDDDKIINALLDPELKLKDKLFLEETISQPIKQGEFKEVKYQEQVDGGSHISVNHDGAGILFVSDSFYPGWKAYIDDQETKIYRANYNFRAVFVPQGEHEIKFLFEPQSFRMGLRVSSITLFLILGILFYEVIKSRRASRTHPV